ncbi:hypothetical protein [Kineococcus arenarius]|uniref:hypothetical protein n=1 Tax=Kineococcus sp. SYSU DK007 TaxID=3383128 RepID=UPI003D7CBA1C
MTRFGRWAARRRAAAGLRTDVRVLLLAGNPEDPTTRAWRAVLDRVGTDHDVLHPDGARPVTDGDLVHGGDPDHGRYHAIIAGTDTSAFWSSSAALHRYRRRFGVRQLAAYEFPRPGAGLEAHGGRDTTGVTVRVTPAGAAVFGYLRGELVLGAGSWGYRATVLDHDRFTTLVETTDGEPVVGVADDGQGLEDVVVLVNNDEWMLHGLLLARGLLTWVTRGTHLGLERHFLSCHVDDVLLANATTRQGEVVPAEHPAVVRMTPGDVEALVAWQEEHGFTFDLAFNGRGAGTDDALTRSLLTSAAEFRWINHTWSHRDLGRAATHDRSPAGAAAPWLDASALSEEIGANNDWARSVGLGASATALVTGVHSGLDNPNLPEALRGNDITAIATDSSLPAHGSSIGPATTVPRHPTNVYAHVSTWGQLLDDYNRQYAPQGVRAASTEEFLRSETTIVLRHVLTNDPGPLFAHQSNLAGERVLLTFVGHVLGVLGSLLDGSAPLVNTSMDEVAEELRRRHRWRSALASGRVTALLHAGALEVRTTEDVQVPLTVPEHSRTAGRRQRRAHLGDAYAGTRSGWIDVRAGEPLRVTLPVGAR